MTNVEKNPFKRIAKELGYEILVDRVNSKVKLINEAYESIKEIDLSDYTRFVHGLKLTTIVSYDGEHHSWISDANGDAKRFEDFLNSDAWSVDQSIKHSI